MIHTAKDILFEQTALYTQISSQVFCIHKFSTDPRCLGLLLFFFLFFFVEQFIRFQQCYVSYHIMQ